ncbi:kelch repeat protein [Gigaspora margarita]|uniref:Kelch repeat protein n=1 Tax=Gigaspora margarita TaxID=4874 RepID=A0A8H3XD10_GIGMA|nr:kelch repeat protein [Gigaspora margarita]
MFSIFIFLQLMIIVNSYSYIPLNRDEHVASYIDNKIFFLGGETDTQDLTNAFFFLDVSIPFNTSSLPMYDLSRITQIPYNRRASSVVCETVKDVIFVWGGDLCLNCSSPLIFAFNTTAKIWNAANDKGIKPPRRRFSSIVCDKKAKIYILDGTFDQVIGNITTYNYSNELDIFDTSQLNWSQGSNFNAPVSHDIGTATLLPDGKIVYIGGSSAYGQYLELMQIFIYDTLNDKWSNMNTTGASPVARGFHTAVLTRQGHIIVYGGENAPFIPAPDQLLDLDTNVQPFKWTIPSINFTPNPAPFKGHTSTLVGDYMIVAFGWCNNGTGSSGSFRSNKIIMLNVNDTNNYMWVSSFTPPSNSSTTSQSAAYISPTESNSNNKNNNIPVIIGIVVGVVGIIIISVAIFLFYRRYNNRDDIYVIPSDDTFKKRSKNVI